MTEGLPLADELSAVYARMSGVLLTQQTVSTALELVTTVAKDAIAGSSGAGATLVSTDGSQTSAGFTDAIVAAADALQYELGEGPCLTALSEQRQVRIDDLREKGEWWRWRQAACELGVLSAVSTPMIAGDRAIGALKVYASQPTAFTEHDENLLTLLANQAAVMLTNVQAYSDARQLSDDLKGALRSRDLINMAKGVLMEREGLDEHAAFNAIVGRSRATGDTVLSSAELLVRDAARGPQRRSR